MKLQLRTNSVNVWYVLIARNGRVLMTSETYSSRRTARRAAEKTATALKLPLEVRA